MNRLARAGGRLLPSGSVRVTALAALSFLLGACAAADPAGGPGVDAATDAPVDANPCASQPWYEPVEQTCDARDNDCDGTVDNVAAPPMWFPDADGDGHGATTGAVGDCLAPAGFVASADDCDDGSAYVFPGRAEVCDGLDNDCAPATAETCSLGCVVRVRPDDGRRYLFCAVASTWTAAEAYCSSQAFRLARLDDAGENTWARTTADGALGATQFYVGGNDRLTEGAWRWNDAVQFWQGTSGGAVVGGLFSSWNSGEPNNSGDEDCAEVLPGGGWNDVECGSTRAFVCERY